MYFELTHRPIMFYLTRENKACRNLEDTLVQSNFNRGSFYDSKHPFRYMNLGTNGKKTFRSPTVCLRKVTKQLNCLGLY